MSKKTIFTAAFETQRHFNSKRTINEQSNSTFAVIVQVRKSRGPHIMSLRTACYRCCTRMYSCVTDLMSMLFLHCTMLFRFVKFDLQGRVYIRCFPSLVSRLCSAFDYAARCAKTSGS